NPSAIISRIHMELERGCTRLKAVGTYSGEEIGTLLCVISRMEVARLKKLIAEEDPLAFVTVCNVHEALGEGFSGIHEQ
ncbi:MAG: YitT family protein, partial [Clostridia bacterium]|nr:YitT family protein [Clostridia bacterium]